MRGPKWLDRSPLRQHFGPSGRAKRSFETSEQAEAFAATKPVSERRPWRAYQCRICKRWHIGHGAAA